MTRCPLCDAEVLYVGLRRVDCSTAECANYRAPEAPPPTPRRVDVEDVDEELAQLLYESWCDAFAFF